MSVTVLCAASPFTSLTTTRAPSAAKRRAVARPMPDPAPVITATLPSSARSPIRSVRPIGREDGDRHPMQRTEPGFVEREPRTLAVLLILDWRAVPRGDRD